MVAMRTRRDDQRLASSQKEGKHKTRSSQQPKSLWVYGTVVMRVIVLMDSSGVWSGAASPKREHPGHPTRLGQAKGIVATAHFLTPSIQFYQ